MNHEQEFIKEVRDELNNLLNKSKDQDEFEYVRLLLRAKGIKEEGSEPILGRLDHIFESITFVNDFNTILKSIENEYTRLRIGLIIYCHIVEMDDLYSTIGNIFNICKGNEYNINMFSDSRSPSVKITQLLEMADELNFKPTIIDLINRFYDNDLRNSFFHSSYFLKEDTFLDTSGRKFKINDKKSTLNIQKYIYPKLIFAQNYFQAYTDVLKEHRMSYKKFKSINLENKFLPNNGGEIYHAFFLVDTEVGLNGLKIFIKKIIEENDP